MVLRELVLQKIVLKEMVLWEMIVCVMIMWPKSLSASSDARLVAVKLYRNLHFHPSRPQCETKPKIYHGDINERQRFILFWKTSQLNARTEHIIHIFVNEQIKVAGIVWYSLPSRDAPVVLPAFFKVFCGEFHTVLCKSNANTCRRNLTKFLAFQQIPDRNEISTTFPRIFEACIVLNGLNFRRHFSWWC